MNMWLKFRNLHDFMSWDLSVLFHSKQRVKIRDCGGRIPVKVIVKELQLIISLSRKINNIVSDIGLLIQLTFPFSIS